MSHKFTLFIYNNYPNAVYSAYQFAKSALEQNYVLAHIFFWRESALIANKNISLAGDDLNLQALWQELSKQYNLQLFVCQASALRRGIKHENLAPHFTLGSLGILSQYLTNEYKLISF
jgi:tRNA 2-thiouridine synthesizing protein D